MQIERINQNVESFRDRPRDQGGSNERTTKVPNYVTFSQDHDLMGTVQRDRQPSNYVMNVSTVNRNVNHYKSSTYENSQVENVETEPDIFSREAADSTLKSQPEAWR